MKLERATRFGNETFSELRTTNDDLIDNYRFVSVRCLEEAVKELNDILPNVEKYVKQAKANCNRNSLLLTVDESAAIYLYTMDSAFYVQLNSILRSGIREKISKWYGFLKLFGNALEKLPSSRIRLWRGVRENIGFKFFGNHFNTWWSINSCTTNVGVAACYLGDKGGTIIAIDATKAKDISDFSAMRDEQEFVLMCGTRLLTLYNPLTYQSLCIIQLEEVE